jgi:hypothetical protein
VEPVFDWFGEGWGLLISGNFSEFTWGYWLFTAWILFSIWGAIFNKEKFASKTHPTEKEVEKLVKAYRPLNAAMGRAQQLERNNTPYKEIAKAKREVDNLFKPYNKLLHQVLERVITLDREGLEEIVRREHKVQYGDEYMSNFGFGSEDKKL